MIDLNDDSAVCALITQTATFGESLNRALDGVRDSDILAETLSGLRLHNPRAVGQLLMELLSDPMERFGSEEKIFWAEVAAHMGPDWIETMRFKAAFMQAVDNFTPRA